MPTTYTHYRFGNHVLSKLSPVLQQQVTPWRGLFDIGLHGPDLLFYYKALSKNHVNQTGFSMHHQPGIDFFVPAASTIREIPEKAAALSYLYGFICHFALDSCCHPYIGEMIEKTGITHSEIEAELDRCLMIMDGLDPITYQPTAHLQAQKGYASVISRFFPAITEKEIAKSIHSIRFYCNALVCPQSWKRSLLFTGLKLAGCYDSIHGMVINYQPNPDCEEICIHLLSLYQGAIVTAVELIENYTSYLQGEQEPDKRFLHTFGET